MDSTTNKIGLCALHCSRFFWLGVLARQAVSVFTESTTDHTILLLIASIVAIVVDTAALIMERD